MEAGEGAGWGGIPLGGLSNREPGSYIYMSVCHSRRFFNIRNPAWVKKTALVHVCPCYSRQTPNPLAVPTAEARPQLLRHRLFDCLRRLQELLVDWHATAWSEKELEQRWQKMEKLVDNGKMIIIILWFYTYGTCKMHSHVSKPKGSYGNLYALFLCILPSSDPIWKLNVGRLTSWPEASCLKTCRKTRHFQNLTRTIVSQKNGAPNIHQTKYGTQNYPKLLVFVDRILKDPWPCS